MPEKFYSQLQDKSLQAYKDWIKGIMLMLTGRTDDTTPEEEWIASWKEFWRKAEEDKSDSTPSEE